MDNLLINLMGMGKQGGTTGNTQLKESAGAQTKEKDFLNILTNVLSGSDSQESLLQKLKKIHESAEPGLAYVMSSISTMLASMVPPNAGTKTAEATGQPLSETTGGKGCQEALADTGIQKEMKGLSGWLEQINYAALQGILAEGKSGKADSASAGEAVTGLTKVDQAEIEKVKALQEEMTKLFSSLNNKSELTIDKDTTPFLDKIGKMPVQNAAAINLQQALLKDGRNAESEAIQSQNAPVTAELFTKDILEKNAVFLRAILENGGKVNREDNSKGNNAGDNKGLDGLLKAGDTLTQNTVNQSFAAEQGLNERGGEKPEGQDRALILNAAKKYKDHLSGTDELTANTNDEIANVSAQKGTGEVPQGDSFRSNVFQVKDNNMTFEKGSFTSFVTDRIEKIVEQFSSKSSQVDMVVRLKLDDKETLLVGLRHEGQKIVVDVKASNDGLVNLLQAHKDDIARNLQDKNIFTSIFVQPDGERNSERQNQRDNNKEDRKQETNTSFVNILDATA
jgi:hypothetical protein